MLVLDFPDKLEIQSSTLDVLIRQQELFENEIRLEDVIKYKLPVISDFNPKTVRYGDELIIEGSNFSKETRRNDLIWFGRSIGAESSTHNRLIFRIDESFAQSPFFSATRTDFISLNFGINTVNSKEELTYIYEGPYTRLDSREDIMYYRTNVFVIGSSIHYYMNHSSLVQNETHFAYNTQTGKWSEKSPLDIAEGRAHAMAFSLNGRGYIGGGGDLEGISLFSYSKTNDFWEYNPNSDSWKKLDDLEFETFGGTAIEYNGKIIYFNDRNEHLYEFDGTRWERSSAIQLPYNRDDQRGQPGSFVYNNEIYFPIKIAYEPGTSFHSHQTYPVYLMKFDPTTESWSNLGIINEFTENVAGNLQVEQWDAYIIINNQLFDPATRTFSNLWKPSNDVFFMTGGQDGFYCAIGYCGFDMQCYYKLDPSKFRN
jgi:hypothetical protein